MAPPIILAQAAMVVAVVLWSEGGKYRRGLEPDGGELGGNSHVERVGERGDGAAQEGVVEEDPDPGSERGDEESESEGEAESPGLDEVVDGEVEREVGDEEDDRVEVDVGEGDSELLGERERSTSLRVEAMGARVDHMRPSARKAKEKRRRMTQR